MARLPTRDDLGPLPPARTGSPIARIDTTAIGEGVRRFGAQVANAGFGVAATVDRQKDQRAAFETEQREQQFRWEEEQRLDEAMRNVQPGQAATFAQDWQSGYLERAKAFMGNVPDQFKPQIDGRLFAKEQGLFDKALTFQRGEQKRVAINTINDQAENIYLPRARTTPTGDLDAVTADAERLIDANPDLTPVEADEAKRDVRRSIALAHVDSLSPDQIDTVIGDKASYADRVVGAEYGSGAVEKNPRSSATGPGQFIDSTWRDFIEERHPELMAQGDDIQKLRSDKALAREAINWYGDKNAAALEAAGLPADNGTKYLAHFAGPDGAIKLLTADPDASAESVLGSAVIRANPFLKDMTASGVVAWAAKKMQATVPDTFKALTDEDRQKALIVAQNRREENQKQADAAMKLAYTQRKNSIELGIVEGTIPDEATILKDPIIDDGDKASLIRSWRSENEKTLKLREDAALFAAGALQLNPVDTDDQKRANALYEDMIGRVPEESQALLTGEFIQQTGVVPKKVSAGIRYGLSSDDPATLAASLATAANIYERAPGAIDNMDGGTEIRDAAAAYRHLIDDRGFSSEAAAKRMIDMRSDDSKRTAAALKAPADEFVKTLQIGDVTDAFDPGVLPWQTDPSAGFNPALSETMMADYREIARDKFVGAARGDADTARTMALAEMKALYGVTNTNGSPTLMKFPPEKYYPQIDGSFDYLREAALADAKAEAVTATRPSDVEAPEIVDLYIMATPTTTDDIREGRLPRYRLYYATDENGQPVYHEVLNGGFGFTPGQIKAKTDAVGKAKLDKIKKARDEVQKLLDGGLVIAH